MTRMQTAVSLVLGTRVSQSLLAGLWHAPPGLQREPGTRPTRGMLAGPCQDRGQLNPSQSSTRATLFFVLKPAGSLVNSSRFASAYLEYL